MNHKITIWIDADACPVVIKEILYKAANRLKIVAYLVANQRLSIPNSPFIKMVQVPQGFDIADNYIVEKVQPNDLVITADVPLAALVIQKKGFALNPRGQFYTSESIHEHLAMRNLKEELRGFGEISSGPRPLDKQNHQAFANALDRFLTKHR